MLKYSNIELKYETESEIHAKDWKTQIDKSKSYLTSSAFRNQILSSSSISSSTTSLNTDTSNTTPATPSAPPIITSTTTPTTNTVSFIATTPISKSPYVPILKQELLKSKVVPSLQTPTEKAPTPPVMPPPLMPKVFKKQGNSFKEIKTHENNKNVEKEESDAEEPNEGYEDVFEVSNKIKIKNIKMNENDQDYDDTCAIKSSENVNAPTNLYDDINNNSTSDTNEHNSSTNHREDENEDVYENTTSLFSLYLCLYDTNTNGRLNINELDLKRGDLIEYISFISKSYFIGKIYNTNGRNKNSVGLVPYNYLIKIYSD